MTANAQSTESGAETYEQIVQCVQVLIRSPHFALCAVDTEGQLTVIRRGIPEDALPRALRGFADAVSESIAKETVEEAVQAVPESHKGTCPSCQQLVVMLPTEDGSSILQRRGAKPRAVCSCGAFLIPSVLDDGGLGLRLMTIEEIAALSDTARNTMLAARRRYASYAAREKARREGN